MARLAHYICRSISYPIRTSSRRASSYNKTLQFITAVKLQELEKQSQAFQTHARVLDEAKATTDPVAKVELLRKASKSWSGALSNNVIKGALNIDNLELWLRQAKQDPTFEKGNLDRWADVLETNIRQTTMRFDSARLFGNLFQEWMSSGDSALGSTAGGNSKESGGLVDAGRKEKQEQLDRFKSFVFEEKSIDTDALRSYLNKVFSSKPAQNELEDIREQIQDFCDRMRTAKITKEDVVKVIDTFLSGQGSMSDDNITELREFRQNDSVLTELASVLTMRLGNIDKWSWPAEGVPVQMRRHLNGKYRAFTDPDIVDALLLHYIGVSWQVELRRLFVSMSKSKAWKSKLSQVPEKEKKRLEEQFNVNEEAGIAFLRDSKFHENFFLCTLSSSLEGVASYDNSANTSGDNNYAMISPVETKQKLLHVLATESQLNTKLYNKHAVVCSDFEWFGPSLPHASILTILDFFGVTTEWLEFFKKWLAAPLRIVGSDDNDGVKVRKCGTPFNYTLSALCGEAVLFVMDFSVNRASDGLHLYRLHDDLWLFDSDATKCARGWKEMNTYANLVGLTFNKEKTGSACVGYDGQSFADLPSGDVRWGFLKFDSSKGRFVIDQNQVDTHIEELRRQLNATKSIMGWINAYNKYMAFLYRNFGGYPAQCFSEDHLDDLLKTFARVQSELFKDAETKSAVAYLQGRIAKKFGASDLPEGYFYFPIATGGLELKNPFIELCSIERESEKNPIKHEEVFEESLKDDDETYESYKDTWERNTLYPQRKFMTYDKYLSLRDVWVPKWGVEYSSALTDREREQINRTPTMEAALQSSQHWKPWYELSVQEKWLLSLYGEQLVDKFGALDVVDSNLIPMGMVELFKRSRIQLDE